MCASLVRGDNITEIPSAKCQHRHINTGCRWNMRLVFVVIWCIFLIVDFQVTNVDIPSDIPEHTKIEQTQSSLQGKETVSNVQATETFTPSSSLGTSLPADQSETSSIIEGTFSSTHVEPSFTDIQGTSQTEQHLTESATQSASVVQSEVVLQDAHSEVETDTENGKSTEDSVVPTNDPVEQSENVGTEDFQKVKESVKVTETEVKDTEEAKVTENVKVTEESEKDKEPSQNITQFKEKEETSQESLTDSQYQSTSQSFEDESAVESSGGVPAVEQKKEGEPAEVETEEKQEEEGLTFNEWTLKVLAEAEKGKLEAKEINQNLQLPPVKLRKKKNYASQECGAKILASNPEASSPRSVLNSNRDEYMNNPCKAKRWFVIELCEPIQAHSVDIASLELFSSQPKMFKLYLSDRYPTKDWKLVGEFTTKEERSIQTFTLTNAEDYFAKFVRVELTQHYGNEHFCPLTIFRVLGIAVVDYEDDHHDMNADDDDDDSDNEDTNESETETGSKNLFTSAKDTVINIVKKVLNVDSEEEQLNIKNGTQGNIISDADNTTMNGTSTTVEQSTLPCVPEVTIDGSKKETCTDRTAEDQQKHTLPQAPEPGKTDSVIVVKLEDDEQVETTPDASPTKSLDSYIHDCFLAMHTLAISEETKINITQSKLCSFVYMLKRQSPVQQSSISLSKNNDDKVIKADSSKVAISDEISKNRQVTSCTIPVQVSDSKSEDVVTSASDSVTEASASSVSSTVQTSKVSESRLEQKSSLDNDKSDLHGTTKVILSTSTIEIQPSTTAEDIIATDTNVLSSTQTVDNDSVTQTGTQISSATEQKEQTESEKIEPSPTLVETKVEATPETTREATPVLPESWKPDTKDLMQRETKAENQKTSDGTITQTDIKDPEPSSVTVQLKESKASSQVNGESVRPTETGDASVTASSVDDTVEDLEALGEDTQDQKANTTVIDDKVVVSNGGQQKRDDLNLVKLPAIPSGKRESAIMRLSNRIKVLEQNVSLSSRFLEELSRRYKKQSEDMMKMLNKTVAAMHNMTVEADVKNKIHEDEMTAMERRLENLTEIVHQLTHSFDKLNRQVTDRQMIWTTIEIAIIIFMVLFLHLRRKKVSLPPEVRTLIESMPSKPSASYPQRRNSVSGPATPSKERNFGNLHLGDSADASSAISNVAIFPFKPGSDAVKKKKKKKHKNLEHRFSSSSSGSSVLTWNSSTHRSSQDSTNSDFQSKETSLLPTNISNQSTKETSHLLAKSTQSKESGAAASCNISQTQSSCFGSFLSGWSNTSKQRSYSLGTEVNEAKKLKIDGEALAKSVQKDDFGSKMGTKGLAKKPPVSGSSKVSPKLNVKIPKLYVNGSVNRGVDQSEFRLEDKKIVKGHRRQKSLPKQHLSSIESVGSSSRESDKNGVQGTIHHFETVPLSSKVHRKGELRKSASLPVSPENKFEKLPTYLKSFANGCHDIDEAANDNESTGKGYSLAKSKSDDLCSTIYGKKYYNGENIFNGASYANGADLNKNKNAHSDVSTLNGFEYDGEEHGRNGVELSDVDNTSSVQNGKNGIWKNVFGYFR
ncbi:SUN domain-containing ossification factor-like isoform X2 [Ruditapes philippinarum]|uniref:SUN domain-containing ossification factor-like isoform X2 n=1 Tax=Ruditapes philippinarum TaxID=129788 RepID=UPI00295B7242|nr:SUN domain-containing ossification factor-like isoform X2 [Ruditapes philippinarum]